MIRKKSTSQTNYEANGKLNYYKSLRSPVNNNLIGKEDKQNSQNKEGNETPTVYTKYGTWSDRIGVGVNIIMTIVTLFLFNQAVRQNSISEKNIALADSVFKLSKQQFDSSIASGKEASENAKQILDLQNRSVQSQVSSLEESHRQFEKQNAPILQVANPTLTFSKKTKMITFGYEVINLGNYPAKTLYAKKTVTFRREDFESVYSARDKDSAFYTYLVKGNMVKMEGEVVSLSDFDANLIATPNIALYVNGLIRYRNLISNKESNYIFQLRMRPNSTDYVFIKNENVIVAEKKK
jgi:hypothetical protein